MTKERSSSSDIILEVLDRMDRRLERMDSEWSAKYKELETEVKGHSSWINNMTGRITVIISIGTIILNLFIDWIKTKFNS